MSSDETSRRDGPPWYGEGYRLLADGEKIAPGDEYLVTRWPKPAWRLHTIFGPYHEGVVCATRRAIGAGAPPQSASNEAFILPLELALTRWAVIHRAWGNVGADCPVLSAFLAGWFCRTIGASMDDVGKFQDSFRAGWHEAGVQIDIAKRKDT